MSDLISRQDAVNEIHKYFVEEIDKTPVAKDEDGDEVYTDMPTVNSLLACNKELSKRIKALPSADAVSRDDLIKAYEKGLQAQVVDLTENRPTGEWIKSNLLPNGWNCDNCGSPIMTDDIEEMLYCPNCGCPMKGGAE